MNRIVIRNEVVVSHVWVLVHFIQVSFKKLVKYPITVPLLTYSDFCPAFLLLIGLGISDRTLIKPEGEIAHNLVVAFVLVVATVTIAGERAFLRLIP